MNDGIVVDLKDFISNFISLAKEKIPAAAEMGMGRAALQLLGDTVMQEPTVPIDEGTLRGSGSAFVQNQLVGESPKVNGNGKPATEDSEELTPKTIIGVVGFNTPYAAKVHEKPMNFQEPSAGNHYLSEKMTRNQEDYFAIVAETIKEEAS